jgi:AcrR family transcriptional regulator
MPAENGLSRREELLTVATKLFAARGYHGTRMDDVADVVGLNKATVYHYYASKSLILYDIYQQAAERTLAAVHDDPSMSAREALYQYTVRLLIRSPPTPRARRSTSRSSPTSPSGSPRSRSPRSARRKLRSTSTCTD